MNFSSTTSSAGCEADLVFGKRLHHLSPSGVAFLIFLNIFNIITFPITAVIIVFYTKIVLLSYHSDITHITHEALVMFFFFSLSLSFFNSLLNPVIYALRMNQFRVAFIELVFRTDVETEMPRFLRVRNSLVRVNVEQDKKHKLNKMSMQQQQS